jgi:hypothetical protein
MTDTGGSKDSGRSSGASEDGGSALDTVQEVAKEAGQEGVPVLAESLLDSLFSDAVRTQVLQKGRDALQLLINSGLASMPESASYGQFRQDVHRAERQLHGMLEESINAIFSGSGRAEFQRHMEEAASKIPEGDTSEAKDQAGEALQALLSVILDVMQRHSMEALRILLGITARALEATFASHVKDAFASITAKPAEELEEKIEPFQEKIAARAEELRERLMETRDTMQQRLAEAKEQIQGRLGTGMPGATHSSQRESKFGAPPSRRPPAGPSGQRPPGKAPRGRPPSGPR